MAQARVLQTLPEEVLLIEHSSLQGLCQFPLSIRKWNGFSAYIEHKVPLFAFVGIKMRLFSPIVQTKLNQPL